MTEKDEFDTDLELEDNAPDDFDDAGFDDAVLESEDVPVKAKKSGGGFLVKFLLLLVLLGGGLFASVKYLGVELPFEVPFLSAQATGDKMPPQPVAAGTTSVADAQPAVAVADNWGAGEDTFSDMGSDTGFDTGIAIADEMPPFGGADTDAAGVADSFGLPVTAQTSAEDDMTVSAWPGAVEDANADIAGVDTADSTGAESDPFGFAQDAADPPVESFVPVTAAVSPAPATEAAPSKDVAALEKKLTALEKTVQQLKTSTASKGDVEALKVSLAKIEKSIAGLQAAPTVTTAPKKAPVESNAGREAAAPVKAAPKKAAAQPVVRKSWVLRSAKPGTAWISEEGSSEMRTVSVGDNVAGIGKVTAIAKDDAGRWVVNGTRGKINQ